MYTHCTYMLYTCIYKYMYMEYTRIYLLKKKTGDRKEAAQKERLQRGAEFAGVARVIGPDGT